MRWWPRERRRAVPTSVRAAVALRDGERVVGAASGSSGGYLIATDRALIIVEQRPGGGHEAGERLRWDLIDSVRWVPPTLRLKVRWPGEPSESDRDLGVDHRAELPAIVRERVTMSIVVSEEVPLAGTTARIVARRNTDTGGLNWRVILPDELDPRDPEVRRAADEAMRDLRVRLGV